MLEEKGGLSKTGIALNYILSFPEVSTVFPDIRIKEQVLANTQSLKSLLEETKAFLQKLAVD